MAKKRTTRKTDSAKANGSTERNGESVLTKAGGADASGAEKKPVKRARRLSEKDLEQFRKLLLERGAEILGDMVSMSKDALQAESANLSHMPIHMADVSSDSYDRELTLGLVESERRTVHEINEALGRIDEGTYGICESTGKPINKARLKAKPWARYCIEAAREMEKNGGGNHR